MAKEKYSKFVRSHGRYIAGFMMSALFVFLFSLMLIAIVSDATPPANRGQVLTVNNSKPQFANSNGTADKATISSATTSKSASLPGGNYTKSNTNVTVNGQHINVPSNGSVSEKIGSASVNITSHNSSYSSSTSVDVYSSSGG